MYSTYCVITYYAFYITCYALYTHATGIGLSRFAELGAVLLDARLSCSSSCFLDFVLSLLPDAPLPRMNAARHSRPLAQCRACGRSTEGLVLRV